MTAHLGSEKRRELIIFHVFETGITNEQNPHAWKAGKRDFNIVKKFPSKSFKSYTVRNQSFGTGKTLYGSQIVFAELFGSIQDNS